jgi:hypothetical protein
MRKLTAMLAVLVLVPAASPAFAQDDLDKVWAKIQPGRAVYTLRQGAGERGSDAAALSGRMIIEARLTCEEIVSTMTMELRATSGAQTTTVTLEQKTTETRDGKVYRFSSRTLENGRESENREGQAVLQTRDGPGEAKIKGAAAEEVKIDAGTILPGTLMLRMLAAAAAGKPTLEARVFYGFDQMKLAQVKVTIKGAGRSGKEKGLGEFADKPGWTIHQEHKELGGTPDSPTQAVEMFVTEDTITTSIKMQVQGLELIGTPLSIEKIAKPECKS